MTNNSSRNRATVGYNQTAKPFKWTYAGKVLEA